MLTLDNTSFLLQKKDTITLSNRIDELLIKLIGTPGDGTTGYLKISDTTSMLTNRISRDTSFLLQKKDTLTLSDRINLKANQTDVINALALKAPLFSPAFTGIVTGIDQTMIGLPYVNNTSDLNKPISLATQSALDLKLNKSDTLNLLQRRDTITLSKRIEALNADTATLIARFDQKFNTSDTSFLLQKKDTITLSDRIDLKLNIGDTLSMLTNRISRDTSFLLQKKDTISLSNRIDLKLNIGDTLSMLTNRISRDTSFLLQKKDTITLSNRIDLKLNIGDTLSMLTNRISRDTSFLLQKKDTITLSNRIDECLTSA